MWTTTRGDLITPLLPASPKNEEHGKNNNTVAVEQSRLAEPARPFSRNRDEAPKASMIVGEERASQMALSLAGEISAVLGRSRLLDVSHGSRSLRRRLPRARALFCPADSPAPPLPPHLAVGRELGRGRGRRRRKFALLPFATHAAERPFLLPTPSLGASFVINKRGPPLLRRHQSCLLHTAVVTLNADGGSVVDVINILLVLA